MAIHQYSQQKIVQSRHVHEFLHTGAFSKIKDFVVNLLVLFLVQYCEGIQLLGHQIVIRAVSVHIDVQGLFVESLGGGELSPLGVESSQLMM